MKSIEQEGVTALLLSEDEREILKRALENAKAKARGPGEAAIIEAAVKSLTRMTKMPL